MSQRHDMQRLQALAQLVLDQRLMALKQAADRLERSRDQLVSINAAAAPADLPRWRPGWWTWPTNAGPMFAGPS